MMPSPPRLGGKENTSRKASLGAFWPVIAGSSSDCMSCSRGRVMWGVMGHLRVFHCTEATDEVEE